MCREILPVNEERRSRLCGGFLDRGERFVGLRSDDRGHASFQNARLLRRDERERVAEKRLVVEVDRCDDADGRFVDHIRRVETPAHADFENECVGGRPRKGEEGGTRRYLEESDRFACICPFAFVEKPREIALLDRRTVRLACKADSVRESGRDGERYSCGRRNRPPRAWRAASPRQSPCRSFPRCGRPAAIFVPGCRARRADAMSARATDRSASDGVSSAVEE